MTTIYLFDHLVLLSSLQTLIFLRRSLRLSCLAVRCGRSLSNEALIPGKKRVTLILLRPIKTFRWWRSQNQEFIGVTLQLRGESLLTWYSTSIIIVKPLNSQKTQRKLWAVSGMEHASKSKASDTLTISLTLSQLWRKEKSNLPSLELKMGLR